MCLIQQLELVPSEGTLATTEPQTIFPQYKQGRHHHHISFSWLPQVGQRGGCVPQMKQAFTEEGEQ
jgi:hypothetical protein